jgi:PD-(D/E)XK nuclease superfamily
MSENTKEIPVVPTETPVVEHNTPEVPKKKRVSFSQYSMWYKCPQSWYLNYAKGMRKTDLNLNIFFGTAMHVALQTFLETLYTKGVVEADSLDLYNIFKNKFKEEVDKEKFEYTDEEFVSYVMDGNNILNTFLSTSARLKYFPNNKYEFIGVEVPLDMDILNNVSFIAYVDLILKDKTTGKYKIYDFKTSTNGWNNYVKEDESKYSQILLYKAFYSKKFNVPLSEIDVEFFIVKRKLYEGVSFPQSRIQTFTPTNTKNAINESIRGFTQFVKECFTENGEYNLNAKYPKIPGKGKKNCKYCGHYKENCDGKADKLDPQIL